MQEVTLELRKREVTGKPVKNLRKAGVVPAVIHDHGKPSIVVEGNYQEVAKAFREAGKHSPIHVKADGKRYITIIKAVTHDPYRNMISHVVFNAVKANEKVTTEVPVRIRLDEGNEVTPAERAGLVVLHNLSAVEIEAPANKLPEALFFDGEKLVEVGDHATVADLIVPDSIEVKTDAAQTVASVFEPSAIAAANDAAGGDADAETETLAESEESNGSETPEEVSEESGKNTDRDNAGN